MVIFTDSEVGAGVLVTVGVEVGEEVGVSVLLGKKGWVEVYSMGEMAIQEYFKYNTCEEKKYTMSMGETSRWYRTMRVRNVSPL